MSRDRLINERPSTPQNLFLVWLSDESEYEHDSVMIAREKGTSGDLIIVKLCGDVGTSVEHLLYDFAASADK
jgi:hypothetical protein